jgi:hypothetical protein
MNHAPVNPQGLAVHLLLIVIGYKREIRAHRIFADHGNPFVHSQETDSQIGFRGDQEELPFRNRSNGLMGKSYFFSIKNESVPELPVGKVLQVLDSEGLKRWPVFLKIEGCAGTKQEKT